MRDHFFLDFWGIFLESNSLAPQFGELHKARVLKEITFLKNWFYEMTDTVLSDPDLEYLVRSLVKKTYLPCSQKNLFFAIWHSKKVIAPINVDKFQQDVFNKNIEKYMIENNLSWDYYKAYIKNG